MTQGHSFFRRTLNGVAYALALFAATQLQGCATTVENLALGAGVGAIGTVSALGCLLACPPPSHAW